MKKKLLWVSDVNKQTGFGQIADNVFPRLIASNKYDIAAMGINYHGGRHEYNGIHVYPCDSQDPYGFGVFPQVVHTEKPDVIFVLQDLFVTMKYVEFLKQHFSNIPTVFYFPIDGNSLPKQWQDTIRYATVPVAYSNYGIDIVTQYCPDLKGKLRMIYHGIDYTNFYPIPDEERKEMRKNNKVADKFVIGIVNRFQPRKMIPLGLRAFSLFNNGYKKCKCGNYYLSSLEKCDLNFCGPEDVIEQVSPKEDVFLYLHMNTVERMMGGDTNTLQMSSDAAGLSPSAKNIMTPGVDVYGPMSPDKKAMNQIYNMLDVYLAVDCGGGFELTPMEALSCGLDIIRPINTTSPELLGRHAYLAKSCGFFSMAFDSGHFRPVVDVASVVDGLEKYYKKWVDSGKYISLDQAKNDYIRKNFNWADKAVQLEHCIDDAIVVAEANKNKKQNIKVINI